MMQQRLLAVEESSQRMKLELEAVGLRLCESD